MSTAKHHGIDESGVEGRRYARLGLALVPAAILLISGCDKVLGIDSPIRSSRDGGSEGLSEAGRGANAKKGEDDAGTTPMAVEPECEDGALRCDDSSSGNRSKCTDGKWVAHEPCDAKQQCDSQDGAACKALPVKGDPCDEAGIFKCTGVAKPERRVCDKSAMVWVDAKRCASGEACDRTNGDCLPIVPACAGHMPGDFVCDGATRHTCGQDLTASMQAECASAAHCQQSRGGTCAICTQGQFMCVGAMLQTCNAAGDGWTLVKTCKTEALCKPEAGDCTTATCTEGQHRCSGNSLEVCNADLTDWQLVKECEDGLCDQVNGECDVCSANSCDGNTSITCADGGQTLTSEACAAPRGICTGAGQCVECTRSSDCTGGDECRPAACEHNSCVIGIREAGGLCDHDNGACDGAGACFASTLARLVPARARPTQTVVIQAKLGRCIHAPSLAVGALATGTVVTLSEDGQQNSPDATVEAAGTDGSQRISIVIPEREHGWADEEIVSLLVAYIPAAGAGGAGGAGATGGTGGTGGAGGAGGAGAPVELGAPCDNPGMSQNGALEFTYRN